MRPDKEETLKINDSSSKSISIDYGSINNENNKNINEYRIGIIYMLCSSLSLSFQGVSIQIGKKLGYDAFELLLSRGIVQLVLNLLLQLILINNINDNRLDYKLFTNLDWIYIIIRGIIGFCVAILFYTGIQLLPLGDASALFSTFPIWTFIVCYIFLNEKINKIHILSLFFGIIGIILISQPTFLFDFNNNNKIINQFGVFSCLFAAICNGFAFLILRKIKHIKAIYAVYSYSIMCIIGSIIYGLSLGFNQWKSINNNGYIDILLLICIGIFGFCGQYFMTKSTQFISGSIASLIRSTDVIFGYLWQILIFHSKPTLITIIGAIFVVIAVIVIAMQKIVRR